MSQAIAAMRAPLPSAVRPPRPLHAISPPPPRVQIFTAIHSIFERNPFVRFVMLGEFCNCDGFAKFMRQNSFKMHYGVDHWPVYLMMSSEEQQYSLSGPFIHSFTETLAKGVEAMASGKAEPVMSLKQLYAQTKEAYWGRCTVEAEMNAMMEDPTLRMGELHETYGMLSHVETLPISEIFVNAPAASRVCMPCKPATLAAMNVEVS